jgi:TPR repeat protein
MEARIDNLIQAAKDGDTYSQMLLGRAYCDGDGVEKDLSEGLRWLSIAEAAGELQAGYVAALYQVQANDGAAIGKLNDLAAEGYFPASYELGNCYYNGWLVERDEGAAIKFWEDAAKHGHIPSKAKLCAVSARLYGPILRCIMIIKPIFLGFQYAAITIRDSGDLRIKGTM